MHLVIMLKFFLILVIAKKFDYLFYRLLREILETKSTTNLKIRFKNNV